MRTTVRKSTAAILRTRWLLRFAAMVWVLLVPRPAVADDGPHRVRVHAAASLTDVLTEIGRRFEVATGESPPVFSFAASSTVVHQVDHGAHVDLVMTADGTWMDLLVTNRQVDAQTRVDLARNRLVAVVHKQRAPSPKTPRDLGGGDVARIGVAAGTVPAGMRAREALEYLGLSEATGGKLIAARNVRGALALAARDQVDAALVYRSDAWASDAVRVAFEIPPLAHGPIIYPAALTHAGAASPAARQFLRFMQGPEAQLAFAEAGFDTASAAAQVPSNAAWRHAIPHADGVVEPLRLSVSIAAMSLALSVVPAVLLGWLLARREFFGKSLVSTALLTPLVLPPVVVGFLLLETFGRGGPLAPLLSALGLQVAFTQLGAVLAAAVVGFPLLVLLSRLAIELVDVRYEQVAQTLGLTPLQAFVRITLPMALPGLAAGCLLAFARALGEFGATTVLASDIPGQTRTLALAIFALYEQPGLQSEAHRLVWISIGLCAAALVGYEWLSRVQKRRLAG